MSKKLAVATLSLFIGLFTLYTMMFGQPSHLFFRPLLLSLMMIMGILGKPTFANGNQAMRTIGTCIDGLMILSIIGVSIYCFYDFNAFILRQGRATSTDAVVGVIYIVIVLVLATRYCGWFLSALATFFFLQALISDKLFWIFYAPPIKLTTMVDFVFMRDEGIFGTPLMSVLSYVIPFIIFTSLMGISGASNVFMDLASCVAGKYAGGPAKVSIISSGLMGTISGSAVANVVGTGSITIPLMKKPVMRPISRAPSSRSPPPAGRSCRRSWARRPLSWRRIYRFPTSIWPPSP